MQKYTRTLIASVLATLGEQETLNETIQTLHLAYVSWCLLCCLPHSDQRDVTPREHGCLGACLMMLPLRLSSFRIFFLERMDMNSVTATNHTALDTR